MQEQRREKVLLGLDLQELTNLAVDAGEPAYRAQQLFHALYSDRVSSPEQISTLPKDFRSALSESGFSIGTPGIQKKFLSTDGTVRYLIECSDGEAIETVWMPEGDGGEAGDGSDAAEQSSGNGRD